LTENKNGIIKETDITIVRNQGDSPTYFTVEVETKFTKKQAEKFYTYISLYHNTLRNSGDVK